MNVVAAQEAGIQSGTKAPGKRHGVAAQTAAIGRPPARDAANQPSTEKLRLRLYGLLMVGDALLILASFLLVEAIYIPFGSGPVTTRLWMPVVPLFVLLAFYKGLYSKRCLHNTRAVVTTAVQAMLYAAIVVIITLFVAKTTAEISRVIFTVGAALSCAAVIAFHLLLKRAVSNRFGVRVQNILIISAGGPQLDLPNAFHLDVNDLDVHSLRYDPATLDMLGAACRHMDRVIVSCTTDERAGWSFALKALGVRGEITSTILRDLGALDLQIEKDFTTLLIATGPLGIRDRIMKRALDLTLTIPALIVLLPVFALIALAILIEDGRPILFRQARIGRTNVFFSMLKFRTIGPSKPMRTASGQRLATTIA